MPASFSQIPANLRVPLFYGEIDASLANTAGAETERALIVGPAIHNAAGGAGQAAGQHLARVESAGQAAEIFGANSGAALMAAAYFANDPRGEVWILGHSVGNNTTASTWSFDGPGGNLAAAIALRVEFAGQEVVVNLDAATTPADAATAMAQAFPVGGNFPLSCAATGADIKFTAAQEGGYFDGGDLTLEAVGGGGAPFDSLVFARGGGQVLGEDDFTDALGDEVFDAVILPSSDFIPGAQAFFVGAVGCVVGALRTWLDGGERGAGRFDCAEPGRAKPAHHAFRVSGGGAGDGDGIRGRLRGRLFSGVAGGPGASDAGASGARGRGAAHGRGIPV